MVIEDDDEPAVAVIDSAGDLLLGIRLTNASKRVEATYRVSSSPLMRASGFYRKLFTLDFSEGLRFKQAKKQLQERYGSDYTSAKLSDLPRMTLTTPDGLTRADQVLLATKLVLELFHREPRVVRSDDGDPVLMRVSHDIDLLAHIVAIADHLDASASIEYTVQQILKVQPMSSKRPRKGDKDSERYWRQLLYMSYIHRQAEAFKWISGAMILYGFETLDTRDPEAPWMDLPNSIEEEIAVRRDGLFNAIASIPNSLLKPYLHIDKSRAPICKHGLGNSPACDSFQLGESLRWLCKRGLLSPNLALVFATPDESSIVPEGHPRDMIKVLKAMPDYQIDHNHSRCGIKGKVTQILNIVEEMMATPKQVGLCLVCWQSSHSDRTSWALQRSGKQGPYQGNLAKDLSRLKLVVSIHSHTMDQAKKSSLSVPKSTGAPECLALAEHELYAAAFGPDKWYDKQWLLGEEPDAPRQQGITFGSFRPLNTASPRR